MILSVRLKLSETLEDDFLDTRSDCCIHGVTNMGRMVFQPDENPFSRKVYRCGVSNCFGLDVDETLF